MAIRKPKSKLKTRSATRQILDRPPPAQGWLSDDSLEIERRR